MVREWVGILCKRLCEVFKNDDFRVCLLFAGNVGDKSIYWIEVLRRESFHDENTGDFVLQIFAWPKWLAHLCNTSACTLSIEYYLNGCMHCAGQWEVVSIRAFTNLFDSSDRDNNIILASTVGNLIRKGFYPIGVNRWVGDIALQ